MTKSVNCSAVTALKNVTSFVGDSRSTKFVSVSLACMAHKSVSFLLSDGDCSGVSGAQACRGPSNFGLSLGPYRSALGFV